MISSVKTLHQGPYGKNPAPREKDRVSITSSTSPRAGACLRGRLDDEEVVSTGFDQLGHAGHTNQLDEDVSVSNGSRANSVSHTLSEQTGYSGLSCRHGQDRGAPLEEGDTSRCLGLARGAGFFGRLGRGIAPVYRIGQRMAAGAAGSLGNGPLLRQAGKLGAHPQDAAGLRLFGPFGRGIAATV